MRCCYACSLGSGVNDACWVHTRAARGSELHGQGFYGLWACCCGCLCPAFRGGCFTNSHVVACHAAACALATQARRQQRTGRACVWCRLGLVVHLRGSLASICSDTAAGAAHGLCVLVQQRHGVCRTSRRARCTPRALAVRVATLSLAVFPLVHLTTRLLTPCLATLRLLLLTHQ